MGLNKDQLYLFFYVTLCFSGYFITAIPLSPVYVSTFIGATLVCSMLFVGVLRLTLLDGFSILISIYILLAQLFFFDYSYSVLANILVSILLFFIVHSLASSLTRWQVIVASKHMVFFSIILLSVEAFYRIYNPIGLEDFVSSGRLDIVFYIYKFNSIMFLDSNFVGLFLLVLIFYCYYLNAVESRVFRGWTFIVLWLLLILTLSRAAIFTSFLFVVLFFFRDWFYRNRLFVFVLMIFTVPFMFFYLHSISSFDDSFRSKFEIYALTYSYFSSEASIWQVLFGVGLGNASSALGIGAHNFISLYFVELGLIGGGGIMAFWFALLVRSRYSAGIILFPFLFSGLSLTSFACAYLYAVLALVLRLSSERILCMKN